MTTLATARLDLARASLVAVDLVLAHIEAPDDELPLNRIWPLRAILPATEPRRLEMMGEQS